MDRSAKLEILVGPAGCGKTAAALAEYRRVLDSRPLEQRRRALWLAPTQAAAGDVRDLLARGTPAAVLDPGVMTFAAFAASIVWDAGLRLRTISPLQRRRLVRHVIAEAAAAGALVHFKPVAGSAGLVNLVDEAIAALKRRGVSAENFRQGSGQTPRRRDLAELYARYEARLAAGRLVDPEGLFLKARDGLRDAPEVGSGLHLIVVDGFSDFTTAQQEILKVLAGRSERTLVTLPGEGGDLGAGAGRADLFAKTTATRLELERDGAVVQAGPFGVPQGDRKGAGDGSGWPAMGRLERNLFRDYGALEAPSTATADSLARMHVVAASSVQAEIDQVARRVKRLLLDGAAPGDVAVAFRRLGDVADRLRAAFDDFGIPAHFDSPRRLAATPLVRSLLGVLRLHAEDWPYRRLLAVAGDRSLGMFDERVGGGQWAVGSNSGQGLDSRSAIEWCVRHAQLPSGRESLLEQIELWAADASEARVVEPAVARTAAEALGGLARAFDELPERAGVLEWIEAIEGLALRLGLLAEARSYSDSAPLPSPPHEGEGARQEEEGARKFEAWSTLLRGLRAVAEVDALTGADDAELTVDEIIELIATTAEELPAPEGRDSTGRVRVLSAEAARFVRPRHLFVGGLSEQAFSAGGPGRVANAETDADDAGQAPINSDRSDEMLLFYQLVTRPTETLTLSYPALDAKAQRLPPSPFLVELERCFAPLALPRTEQPLGYATSSDGPPLSRSDLRRTAVLEAAARKRELLAATARSPRFGQVGQAMLDGVEVIARRGDRKSFGAFEGVFSLEAAPSKLLERFGPDQLWSPSLLETYAACPYRFFGEHVLKLAPLPELALESDLARRGSVLHDTLARLYARLSADAAEGVVPTPAAVAEQFQQALEGIVAARPRRGLEAALREIERRQIAAWAPQFARQHQEYAAAWAHIDAPLTPTYFEARFGPKHRRSQSTDDAKLSTDRPYEVTIDGERVRFTGQIDRIDVGRVGDATVFNVIDYKTSAKAQVKDAEIRAGRQIQLPLYAMAVAELLLADQQAAALSAGYWSIRGKGFQLGGRSGGPLAIGEIRNGKVQMAAHWTELRETLLGRIGEIVTGIRRGWFPVFNEDKECGRFCPFSTACRIGHVRSLEKEWLPPAEEA